MKNRLKVLTVMLLAVIFIAANSFAYATPNDINSVPDIKEKKLEPSTTLMKDIDENNNKVFDQLDTLMDAASDTDELPVIVVFNDKMDSSKKDMLSKITGDIKVKHEFETIPGMALTLSKKQIDTLSKLDFIKQVEYDAPVHIWNDKANYWFGTQKAYTDFGVDGDRNGNPRSYSKDDIVIAVIDTGIDAKHVDLDGGKVIGWKDVVNGKTTPYDDNGHGTHCASIATGEGDGNSAYKGVAPGAALVGVKVLDSQGSGSMSDVTAGIDWAVANKATYGIEIISLSLGTDSSSNGQDSTSLAVNNAVNSGIVVCVAAGNSGPSRYTIGSPGAAANAITVAAMADVGEMGFNLAYFSSRGPTADGRTKPDIAAPGYNITAAKANSTNGYVQYSGTSMATPFTAGTVALMLDAKPDLTPAQVKNIITTTALDWGISGNDIDFGYGRLDGYSAIKSAGGLSGTNITVPNHLFASETLDARNASDLWTFNVTDTSYPISVTFIMNNWSSSSSPDFDIYLYNPSGSQIASATSTQRQETLTFTPTAKGTYTLKVYSYAGTGNYSFDLSAGASGLTITQDN